MDTVRKNTFGINSWRPLQQETINATMAGHDVLLIMPTGGGKSLTYQLPAVLSPGFTLVVSPLVSLMQDQIWALQRLNGVAAAMLDSSSTKEHVAQVKNEMVNKSGSLKLLYVTPERLARSKQFMNKLEKSYALGLLSRIAIDEVHCCSQWGHDFRPDYKFLNVMKRQFPNTPIIGLTATATAAVIEDVKTILRIPTCLLFKAGYNRPNLFYEVRQKKGKAQESIQDIANAINARFKNQSGIIYCFSKKDSHTVADSLGTVGIKAEAYNADLTPDRRSKVHSKWLKGTTQVVVATTAFGMGIDKPDVRFVIHHSLSKSLENYYQESGRAGRDDKPATCILFFRLQDMFRVSSMVMSEQTGLDNLYQMVAYCADMGQSCRRKLVAEHFNETWTKKQCDAMCDHCRRPREPRRVDVTSAALAIIAAIEEASKADQRLTAQKVVDQTYKSSSSVVTSVEEFETMLAVMILEGYLKEDFHFTAYATISYLIPGPKAGWLKRGGNDGKFFLNLKSKSTKSAASHTAICPRAVEDSSSESDKPSTSSSKAGKNKLAPTCSSAGTKNHVGKPKIKKNGDVKKSKPSGPKAPEIEEASFVMLDSDSD